MQDLTGTTQTTEMARADNCNHGENRTTEKTVVNWTDDCNDRDHKEEIG